MTWRAQIDERGIVQRYKDLDTGEVISAKEYERRAQMEHAHQFVTPGMAPQMTAAAPGTPLHNTHEPLGGQYLSPTVNVPPPPSMVTAQPIVGGVSPLGNGLVVPAVPNVAGAAPVVAAPSGAPSLAPQMPPENGANPLIQPGAQILTTAGAPAPAAKNILSAPGSEAALPGMPAGHEGPLKAKNLRMEGIPQHTNSNSAGYKAHGFLDATSIAILLPTLVLLALIIAAAHKKRLFPWQTIRTFNPPSGLMSPREYERSFLCPPNLRRHGRLGKRNPNAAWNEQDGIVIPFGFLARTHLPVTIPLGRLPNKNMFIVAPSGSGKTTLMRAVMKALLAKPCVIIALEAKANDPNLDEKREGFKYSVLPEAQQAGFECLYFNPLDSESIHWNPLDLDPITFASSIVTDVNTLPPEEQHWAERDHGYITGLVSLLKWGAVQVTGEDENGVAADVAALPCNPRGLMRLVNNRRNIVESLRRCKQNPNVDAAELNELTQMLSSIIRTDSDWDKNIQGIRGRLRMFKNPNILRVTEKSNIDLRASMHKSSVLIFGCPASLGPDAESLASTFVYQLQQALHTRYGTASVLPLFAFFDEYQTLNIDLAGRLSAIVRGANGGLTVILQNISQIAGKISPDPTSPSGSELRTIFSNSAIRVCLHNADESTARFFSDEIGKHAVIVPGISDHYDSAGFGIFPGSWNRIHSQQVVARVDPDSIKRMEKQHALVYLSPAGDPQFGETKPFMCDLRGIEEIAKLHLLHNVTRGVPPTGGPGGNGNGNGGNGGGPFPMPVPGAGLIPSTTALAGAIAGNGNGNGNGHANGNGNGNGRMCPHCNQAAGKGRFCIECGKPIPNGNGDTNGHAPVNGAPEAAPQFDPTATATVHGEIIQAPAPAMVAPMPFPVAAPVAPTAAPPVAMAHPAAPAAVASAPAALPGFAQVSQQPALAAAMGQIRRGTPEPMASAPQAPQQAPMPQAPQRPQMPPQMPAMPAAPMPMPSGIPAGTAPAQQRPTHRDAAAQPARPPVTSMSPDPNRIPIPRPQQEPEKPKKGGVEF